MSQIVSIRPLTRSQTAICVIGRTGDGKSTFCNLILKELFSRPARGGLPETFSESNAAKSHTHDPKACLIGNDFMVIDFPGLMDSAGEDKDIENLKKIVNFCRTLGQQGPVRLGFIMIVNDQCPRFDSGMQNASKLLYDSFGPKMLANSCIVFTRSFSLNKSEESRQKTKDIVSTMVSRGIQVGGHTPCWQVNSRPEDLADMGVSDDIIMKHHTRNNQCVNEIARWAASLLEIDVSNAIYAKYDGMEAREAAAIRIKELEASLRDIEEKLKQKDLPQVTRNQLQESKEANSGMMGVMGAILSGVATAAAMACVIS